LKQLGVTKIISFIDDSFLHDQIEAPQVQTKGMKSVHIPISMDSFNNPIINDSDVAKLAEEVKSSEGSVFVHCSQGKKRTPMMVWKLAEYLNSKLVNNK